MSQFSKISELKQTFPSRLVIIFTLFTIAIIILSFSYYKSQRRRIIAENQNYLTAVSELKTEQIVQWHSERMSDAAIIKDNAPLVRSIGQYFNDRGNIVLKNDLTRWMESVTNEFDYSGVAIIDPLNNPIINASHSDSVRTGNILKQLKESFETQSVIFCDLHRTGDTSAIHIDILIPLVEPGTTGQPPFGIMILRINPSKKLYPLIQSWPTLSKTSETLLLRKDGDSVLFLNELRHTDNRALSMKLPLASENLLGAMAVRGSIGVAEGVDYRNIPAIGYLNKIPGLGWYMVTKVDREELLAPLRGYALFTLIVAILLIVANALIFIFFIWNQRVGSYRNQLKSERAIREAEEILYRTQTILQTAMDQSQAGIAIADAPDGKLRYVNDAGLLIRGGDRDNATNGVSIDQYVASWHLLDLDGRPLEADEVPLARAIMFGEKCSREFIIHRGDNDDRIVVANAAPIKDSEGKVISAIVVFLDITEFKQMERELRKSNEELEERVAERTAQLEAANKELETFSYSVSHDLRAPLRTVNSFTEILLAEYEEVLDDEGKRLCGIISSGATQMGALIDDLLSFSRVGRSSLKPSLLDMKSMVTSVFVEITSEREKERTNIKIGKLHKGYADANLIRLVWTNLISNAIKYSSKKNFSEITIASEIEGDMIVYSIKDNGVGFQMQYVHKLFGVFQRLHSETEFEGNGVGLANVKRIITQHNGKVWAEGELDKGATFYFSLPREDGSQKVLVTSY